MFSQSNSTLKDILSVMKLLQNYRIAILQHVLASLIMRDALIVKFYQNESPLMQVDVDN